MRGMEEETTQQQAAVDGDHRFVGSGLITRPSNASAAGSPFLDVNQLSQTSVEPSTVFLSARSTRDFCTH